MEKKVCDSCYGYGGFEVDGEEAHFNPSAFHTCYNCYGTGFEPEVKEEEKAPPTPLPEEKNPF